MSAPIRGPVPQDSDASLADTYKKTLKVLERLDSGELFPLSDEFKQVQRECLDLVVRCIERVRQLGLFSPNETWDDIQTMDLRYLNLNFYLARVLEKTPVNPKAVSVQSRINVLNLAVHRYLEFLYDLMDLKLTLSTGRGRVPVVAYIPIPSLLPQGKFGPFDINEFEAVRRNRRTKAENLSRLNTASKVLELTRTNVPVNDEEKVRQIEADRLTFHWYSTWESLFGIIGELDLLHASTNAFGGPQLTNGAVNYVPASRLAEQIAAWNTSNSEGTFEDLRARMDKHHEAEDMSRKVEAAADPRGGRLVNPDGSVQRPFVIMPSGGLDRSQAARGVFGTGQRLPTVSIEELVEKELANQVKPQVTPEELREGLAPDSDEEADILTMKARRWDDFTEANPRGSGNTLNLG